MPMAAYDIEQSLRDAFPDAEIDLRDLAGDNDHYQVTVVSSAFQGLTRVHQHKLVFAALGGRMGGELHALAVETKAK